MNREEFFAKLAALDEAGLKKALWNLYWRGTAAVRERIEGEIVPGEADRARRAAAAPADPAQVLREVSEFAELARCGAYLAGDRRVSPRERSRWRLTFRRLAADAQRALLAEDPASAEAALAQLIDLACETRDYDYFHSEDPMEAARFVVSDAVALLWETLLHRYGFAGFVQRAAPQLIRWESRFGWTRSGWGELSGKETALADVLARMLRTTDMWVTFTDRYLDALDEAVLRDEASPKRTFGMSGWDDRKWKTRRRAEALSRWHLALLDRLDDAETQDRLDRLVRHPALTGPELTLMRGRLAQRHGDVTGARDLVREVLVELPGHDGALDFAAQVGASLPPGAQRIAQERASWQAMMPSPEQAARG
jgi:hypothetical protein